MVLAVVSSAVVVVIDAMLQSCVGKHARTSETLRRLDPDPCPYTF